MFYLHVQPIVRINNNISNYTNDISTSILIFVSISYIDVILVRYSPADSFTFLCKFKVSCVFQITYISSHFELYHAGFWHNLPPNFSIQNVVFNIIILIITASSLLIPRPSWSSIPSSFLFHQVFKIVHEQMCVLVFGEVIIDFSSLR